MNSAFSRLACHALPEQPHPVLLLRANDLGFWPSPMPVLPEPSYCNNYRRLRRALCALSSRPAGRLSRTATTRGLTPTRALVAMRSTPS